MKKSGGGKGKGSAFERSICKLLSRWVSKGRRTDLFWRTAMSGGRATVARRKGVVVRQAGDVCAVSPQGHSLTHHWLIECKFYRRIMFGEWVVNNEGPIRRWWEKIRKEAREHGREPMLIVKQNGWPVLVITRSDALERWTARQALIDCRHADVSLFSDLLLVEYGHEEQEDRGDEDY